MTLPLDDETDFNRYLDGDGEIVIEGVPFQRSAILATDPDGYREAFTRWQQEQRKERFDRTVDRLPDRSSRLHLTALLDLPPETSIVPFVGAGLSIPCDLPGWTKYLVDVAGSAHQDVSEISAALTCGLYEETADLIIDAMGEAAFNKDVRETFGSVTSLTGPATLVPFVAGRVVITTNFDSVLEQVFREAGQDFDEVVVGNRDWVGFRRAITDGRMRLIKLHGDAHDSATRVLTTQEYRAAYGDAEIDYSRHLPDALREAFRTTCLVFLGCSLGSDRTMALFAEVAGVEGDRRLPDHYAVLERPPTDQERASRDRFLTERNVFPIWYETGQHDVITDILVLVAYARH